MDPFLMAYALLWVKIMLFRCAKNRCERRIRQCRANQAKKRRIRRYMRQKRMCLQRLAVRECAIS